MKKLILIPLSLGLMLAGCSRTNTDSSKVASIDQTNANKPAYDDKADATKTAAADQALVAAPATTAPTANTDPAADAQKSGPDAALVAASPTSSAATAATAPATPITPTTPPVALTTQDASLIAVEATKAVPSLTDKIADFSKPAISARLTEWKLSAADIKQEFETSGRVDRSKTIGAGEPTGPMDGALVILITAKLQADADLAGLKLDASADKGVVTLAGSAKSLDQIGKAVAIALDTEGATQAISTIKLD